MNAKNIASPKNVREYGEKFKKEGVLINNPHN